MTWDQYHSKYGGNGRLYDEASGLLTTQKGVDGAAVTINHNEANPRYLITPDLAGNPTPEILLDGESAAGTDYIPRYALVTVNPGDDVTAATRLMNGFPDVIMVQPGETLEINAGEAITEVHLIGIVFGAGGAAVDIDTFTDYAGLIGRGDTDLADWIAQDKKFTFDLADDVRKVRIIMTDALDTNVKLIRVEGLSYA